MIDFDKIKQEKIDNLLGGWGSVLISKFEDDKIKIVKSVLKTGCSTGRHVHKDNCEVMYVISGKATINIDERQEILTAGQCHYCPKGSSHAVFNLEKEDLVLFAVVPIY